MRSKSAFCPSGFTPGRPAQDARIVSASAEIKGGTALEESDGGGCIKRKGTEWNFATQF